MKNVFSLVLGLLAVFNTVATLHAQTAPICIDGSCQVITLVPLAEQVFIDTTTTAAIETSDEDRFDQVIRATVRVTVSGICGSGTVVGRDANGNALVLTNAHVAGTARGRLVNVERWNTDGTSERGQGSIIAAGYGRGLSVDFALLKCNSEFANGVIPIPLANRYPDPNAMVTTSGCPRCEWPSLQVLKLNRREGQVLTWKPEAIGGRSGSSVIDHTDAGLRVVGLLTWGGNGEGLGQSTPFLLEAMKGRLPTSLESLPTGVKEVSVNQRVLHFIATHPIQETATEDVPNLPVDGNTLDSITEPKHPDKFRTKPNPDEPRQPVKPREPRIGFFENLLRWFRDRLLVFLLIVAGAVVGFIGGVVFAKTR
ncbi:MAG: trypsin-like peptidase domain-containing protein [Pirellulaceae bacterium]|nr:trypsin-like peptidase domain-containing protein [Pirellulaceae bacterium]